MNVVVDTHTHLWHCEGEDFSWIAEGSPIRRDFLIKDLEEVLLKNKVKGSLLVQAVPDIAETQWLLNIAKHSEKALGVIGWVDITKGASVKEDLDALLQHSSWLKGIRYMSQGLPPEHLYTNAFIEGVKAVGHAGLVYELLITEKQLEAAYTLIKACPEVQFVIEHIAKPNIAEQSIELWQKGLRQIAQDFSNVHCKVSGVVTEAKLDSWQYEDIEPYLATVFECFGVERTLFGSDWPVCLLATTYDQWLATLHQFFQKHSIKSTEKFYADNAKKLYKLTL